MLRCLIIAVVASVCLTPCQDCYPVQLGHCTNALFTDAQVDPKLKAKSEGVCRMVFI